LKTDVDNVAPPNVVQNSFEIDDFETRAVSAQDIVTEFEIVSFEN
jgi:hypothetical protein